MKKLKTIVAMVCITALGVTQLIMYGDGSTLVACVTAVTALAGVQAGYEIGKKTK